MDNVTLAPDGIQRQMMAFNNSFPGPLLEANWGDNVVVHVTNNLQNNGYHSSIDNSNSSGLQSTGTESYRNITVRTMVSLESHNVPSHPADPSHTVGEPLVMDRPGTTVTLLYNTRMVYLVPFKYTVRQLRIGTLIWGRC